MGWIGGVKIMPWQPINTAPKDGTLIVCWRKEWENPRFLCWKTNPRIAEAIQESMLCKISISVGNKRASYFGDPIESDDYELAVPNGAPTHWHPLEPLP